MLIGVDQTEDATLDHFKVLHNCIGNWQSGKGHAHVCHDHLQPVLSVSQVLSVVVCDTDLQNVMRQHAVKGSSLRIINEGPALVASDFKRALWHLNLQVSASRLWLERIFSTD